MAEEKKTQQNTPGSIPQVAKSMALSGGKMDVTEEDCVMEFNCEGPMPSFVKDYTATGGVIKAQRKRGKVTFNQRNAAQARSSDQQSTSCTETTARDPSTKEAEKAPEETTKAQDNVTVSIRSQATKKNDRHMFRKSDKVKMIREKIGVEDEYQLFKSDETKLKEDETFEQNGIQPGDTITVAKEEIVECGTGAAPGGCKA